MMGNLNCLKSASPVAAWKAWPTAALLALGLLSPGHAVANEEPKAKADANAVASDAAPTVEKLPPGTQLASLVVSPEKVELEGPFAYRQLLITGKSATGETFDVTRMVTWKLEKGIVSVSPNGLVRPLADGADAIVATLGDRSITIPVTVSQTQSDRQISYVQEVMPVLAKLGCNQGLCHGGAKGKAGFQLSLRGYDPVFDHRALTDDVTARRFNRAAPEKSLLLLKPLGEVPHVGGVLMKADDPNYGILKNWIAQGAGLDAQAARVTKIEISPTDPVVSLPGMRQQIQVIATYSDGKRRDVSAEAFIESGNTEVAEASKDGIVTALRRGEAPVLCRFEGAYAATTITVMGDRSGFVWKAPPENNYIDTLVHAKLAKVKTAPSDLCTDAEFIRRVYLDLTGLAPTADQTRQFLNDSRPTRVKRDELIDRLVGSPDYIEYMTNKWSDLLQVNSKVLGEQGAWGLRNWIKQAVATNMPYDRFVYEVLTATGSTVENPPASYYKTIREPGALMENTTQLFLGIRFSCNNCHDHPFEKWTQAQHWQMAAYFAKVGRKEDPNFAGKKIGGDLVNAAVPMVEVIYDGDHGEVKHPNSGDVQTPAFPYQSELAPASLPERQRLAAWVTSPHNEYFARSYVNRVWSYLTGVGFIEPVDDLRAGNPATNPELLDRLTRDFISSGFDVQRLVKLICKSRTYQLSIATNKWNEDDQINYSHAQARRLPAEVLYDTVYQVTGSKRNLSGLPAGFRAIQQRDATNNAPDGFLDLFGRPPRESACECERVGGVMLGQTLNLVNGPTVAEAIAAEKNSIETLVAQQPDDAKLVDELFYRVLNRPATAKEIENGKQALRASELEYQKRVAAVKEYEKTLPAKQAAWEAANRAALWAPLDIEQATSASGATLTPQADGSYLASGKVGADVYTVRASTKLPKITALRLEALPDAGLPQGGPGRAADGNFTLTKFSALWTPTGGKPTPLKLNAAASTHSQPAMDAQGALDDNANSGWAIGPEYAKRVPGATASALFTLADDLKGADGKLTIELHQGAAPIGRFKLYATGGARPVSVTTLPAAVESLLAKPAAQLSQAERAELAKYYRENDAELTRLNQAVSAVAADKEKSRLLGAQDLVWALINSPAFLFNR